MRTNFRVEDIKNLIEEIFNGNLRISEASNGSVTYKNDNSEEISINDENDGTIKITDLAKYLNVHFYVWKHRIEEKGSGGLADSRRFSTFEDWVESLNFSLNEAYALIEKVDEEALPSQDIDSATIIAKISFLIQADKVGDLDHYVSKIRNKYLGVPQDFQNAYGEKIKFFLSMGSLNYEEDPSVTQLGETVMVTSNVRISYLNDAQTWADTKIEISLDNEEHYYEMPITRSTRQDIFTSNPVPVQDRPDLTGFVAVSLSTAQTLSFYDFNKELTNALNDLFYSLPAVRKNDVEQTKKDVNVPVFFRITNNGNTYVYKEVIANMQKVLVNSDFNISSITTKGWGKRKQIQGDN